MTANPAEVVKETASTITVRRAGSYHEYVFQKRKRYGDGWEDARALNGCAYGLRSQLHERGYRWSSTTLSFDVERVEERLAHEAIEKDFRARFAAVETAATEFFQKHRRADGTESAMLAVLSQLETALSVKAAEPIPT